MQMNTKKRNRDKRVERIIDSLRTYGDFVDNYGGCVKSIDQFCNYKRSIDEKQANGSQVLLDIIRAYNKYTLGTDLDDIYRGMCKNNQKRRVYHDYLFTDWSRAISKVYSYGWNIAGLSESEAKEVIKAMCRIVK